MIWALQCASSCRMPPSDSCDAQEQGPSIRGPVLQLSSWAVGLQVVLHLRGAISTGAGHCQAAAQPAA